MASLWQSLGNQYNAFRTALGGSLAEIGYQHNLPELHLSEIITPAYAATPNIVSNNTYQGGGGGGGGGAGGVGGGGLTAPAGGGQIPGSTATQQSSGPSPEELARLEAEQRARQEAEINSIYNPAMESLATAESRLRARREPEEAQIKAASEELQKELQNEATKREYEITSQQKKIGQERQTALGQARQLYNELMGNLVTRFGGSTSAGPAAGEILGRATAQQMGGIETQAQNLIADLSQKTLELHNSVDLEKQRILRDRDSKLYDYQTKFNDALDSIANQRGALESAKGQARLDLLNQYKQAASAVASSALQSFLALDVWKNQQQAALSNSYSQMTGAYSPETIASAISTIYGNLDWLSTLKPGQATSQAVAKSYGGLPSSLLTEQPTQEDELWNPYEG